MREGFVYMVRTPWLLATLLFASLMILVMMGPFEVLIPFLIKDRLGGGPGDHALVLAAFGIGGAVGLAGDGLVPDAAALPDLDEPDVGRRLPAVRRDRASPPRSGWSSPAAFVLGALFSAPMVIWGTLLQRRVPPHLLGRVASLDFFVSVSLMPVSMALAGPVSEAIGLRTTFPIAGIAPVIFAVVAIWWAKLPRTSSPTRCGTRTRSPNRPRSCRPSCASGCSPRFRTSAIASAALRPSALVSAR